MKVIGIIGPYEDQLVEVLYTDDNEIGYHPIDAFKAEFGLQLINEYYERTEQEDKQYEKSNTLHNH